MGAKFMAAGAEHNPLIPPLPEIILSLTFFLILVFAITKFVAPKFEEIYEKRRAEIEGGIEEAGRAQKEADEALAEYKAKLADARHEATRIREEAREQSAQIIAEAKAQAQAEAERATSAAQSQIEAERAAAMASLKSEVGAVATQLAERIVGESLEDEVRQRRTIERFIADLESGSSN